jgi:Lon protease-like protein
MVADALRDDLCIGLAKMCGSDEDDMGRPRFENTFGVGRIIQHEVLGEGRYNILLVGLERAMVVNEHDPASKMYRRVRAEIMVDHVENDARCEEIVRILRQTISSLHATQPSVGEFLMRRMGKAKDFGAIADRVANVIFPQPTVRQLLLEEPRVEKRLKRCLGRTLDILASAAGSDRLVN